MAATPNTTVPLRDSSFWRGRCVVVTGGAGFLGSHVVRRLQTAGATVVVPRTAEHDLTQPGVAAAFFDHHQPSHVIHLAARVGGIGYNQVAPAPLFLDNLQMGVNVIEAARSAGVEKTVVLGTVCSYPKFTPVPFREESIWDGYPEETNAPYGIAKKALLVHAQVNRQQYGQRFAFVIPTNLYGPGDKFHESVSHVIPALIKKCVDATEHGVDKVHVWGTGSASRDYLFVGDAADAIVLAAELHDGTEPLNLGNNREITIRETAETIARIVGFDGDLVWDSTKPDGQPRRRVDASRAEAALGWHASTTFEHGLRETVEWYLANRAVAEAAPR
ncbi:MAG: GDP-L-fucose synthase family protein [Ilumatobacteraceae bacterium]